MKLDVTMNTDEIDYFKDFLSKLKPDSKFVEWGSGGSTTLFLDYFADKKLVSIEHNETWYDKVTEAIADEPNRDSLQYLFIPPNQSLDFYGYGVPKEENPTFNDEYINPETAFPDVKIFDADVFLVDGISRGACLATVFAMAKNRDATVFIHDYAGREDWYRWATNLYPKIEQVGSTLLKLSMADKKA